MEAADGGDPRKDVPVRDRVFLLDAPFDGAPRMLAELPLRVGDISWSSDRLALLGEYRWRDRKRIILAVALGGGAAPFTVFEGSYEDARSEERRGGKEGRSRWSPY